MPLLVPNTSKPYMCWGILRNKSVTVLIDEGNTHNFIDQAVVSKFGLLVNCSKQFNVMVATWKKITCNGQCQCLTLNIQGQTITVNYYILPITVCQLILGVQWLKTFGPIEMDFKKIIMSYKKQGETYIFHRLKHTDNEAFTSKKFYELQGFDLFLQIIPFYPSKNTIHHPPKMNSLLSKFSHMFEQPTSLPPKRSNNHHMPLQPNSRPVRVRPY
jgi:hypothetical protein